MFNMLKLVPLIFIKWDTIRWQKKITDTALNIIKSISTSYTMRCVFLGKLGSTRTMKTSNPCIFWPGKFEIEIFTCKEMNS